MIDIRTRLYLLKRLKEGGYNGSYVEAISNAKEWVQRMSVGGVVGKDWVEDESGKIYWDDKAVDQLTTKQNERYLGRDVVVAEHNRDENLNEPINTGILSFYSSKNKSGPAIRVPGNTVPADISKHGVVAEGLYDARLQGRSSKSNDRAIMINKGGDIPTANPWVKPTVDEVFYHIGNKFNKSLITSNPNINISEACITGYCGEGGEDYHNKFMDAIDVDGDFAFYIKGQKAIDSVSFVNKPPVANAPSAQKTHQETADNRFKVEHRKIIPDVNRYHKSPFKFQSGGEVGEPVDLFVRYARYKMKNK